MSSQSPENGTHFRRSSGGRWAQDWRTERTLSSHQDSRAGTHHQNRQQRSVGSRFPGLSILWQAEKAHGSGFSPTVCSNQLRSASKNGLFKRNQSEDARNLARKLGGEGQGGQVEVFLAWEHLWELEQSLGHWPPPSPELAYSQKLPAFWKEYAKTGCSLTPTHFWFLLLFAF